MTEAVDDFVAELAIVIPIPILACHFHFLRDIGRDLLKPSHDQLRELVRRWKISTHAAALARDLGRHLGSHLAEAREGLVAWQEHVHAGHRLPEGRAGIACVRALTQWVLDFAADGHNDGFPFDRRYLDFYERGFQMRRAIDAYHRQPPATREVARALRRLGRVLDPLRHDEKFAQAATTLNRRAALFEKLREAIRLKPKQDAGEGKRMDTAPTTEAAAELRNVRREVLKLCGWLRENRPARGPAEDQRKAVDIILRHLHVHGSYLWGHEIRLTNKTTGGETTRLADRFNIIEESWFHGVWRGTWAATATPASPTATSAPARGPPAGAGRPGGRRLRDGERRGPAQAGCGLISGSDYGRITTRAVRQIYHAPASPGRRPAGRPPEDQHPTPRPSSPGADPSPSRIH